MNGLERDTLFVALTRPQMFAGVTYSYFIANAVIATELFLIFRSVWALVGGARRPPRRRAALPARAALLRSVADPGQPLPARAATMRSGDATPIAPDPRPAGASRARSPPGIHLPYARHVDDHTIETRDGLLMQVIHLRGLLFETADTDEINYRKRLRDAMLQSIGSSRFALYHHIVRRRIDAELVGRPSRRLLAPARRRLAGAAGDQEALRQRAVPDPGPPPAAGPGRRPRPAARACSAAASRGDGAGAAYELRELDAARDALLAALGSYGPRLLGVYETPQGPCSEPLEFLSALYNGEMRPVLLPTQDLGAYLPYRRVSFGQETVELGPAGPTPRSFLGMVSIKDYPGQTAPGMLDELLRLPFELVVSQSFGFVERQAALGADEPGAAPDALGRGRGGEPARRARRAPRTRSPPAAPASASIT